MIEFISLPFAMVVTAFILPFWIRGALEHGLVSKDVHKRGKHAANIGGLCIIAGFLAGVLFFVGYQIFVKGDAIATGYLFAALCSILIATVLGFADDILGWKIGLRQWHKVVLSLGVALPMVVLNAGESMMRIPFIGQVNIGLLFPLVVIPPPSLV